jgi:hypothetical protein
MRPASALAPQRAACAAEHILEVGAARVAQSLLIQDCDARGYIDRWRTA